MDLPFDTTKGDAKLAEIRQREEEDLARILSEKYGMQYADLSMVSVDAEALRTIPEKEARETEAVAFAKNAHELSLALRNPNNPAFAKLQRELEERGFSLTLFLVSKKSLEKAHSHYRDLSFATAVRPGTLPVDAALVAQLSSASSPREALKDALDAANTDNSLERVSLLLATVFAGGFALRASDIHLEPEETHVRLRLRVDGQLIENYFFDAHTYHQINSRLKVLSSAKLNVDNRAQDGRFTVLRGQDEIEVRSSFIPGAYGESVVMRLLDPSATQVPYTELGIHSKLLARLEQEIRRANGMLLTTGPTGSGKTTTLYAFLREVYQPEVKIITIEDPIEYHLEGIVQTQVESEKYSFSDGLRSIVRQDPDIIMVGEIRDSDTANIAIEAALTGHFVFSTLHTNDAAGTFPRLTDLGADPKSFGSAITVSMAQRLVRKLDPKARAERPLTEQEKRMIAAVFEPLTDKSLIPEKIETVWDPAPKSADQNGYKGRVGLYEAIFMDDELATLLRDNPPSHEIAKSVARQGYLTMAQDGILKALAGLTSLEEVAATVDLPQVP